MSDHKDRDGGGLAVLVMVGILAVLVLACGGVGFVLYKRLAIHQAIVVEEVDAATVAAERANRMADETAMNAAAAAIEIPAEAAPKKPKPTQ